MTTPPAGPPDPWGPPPPEQPGQYPPPQYVPPPGQPQYVPPPGQPQYGQPPGQPQYGQPSGQSQHGQQPYDQPPYGQQPYGAYLPAPDYSAYSAPQTSAGVPASMGSRLAARIIDGLIIGIPAGIVVAILVVNIANKTTCNTDQLGTQRCTTSGGIGGLFLAYLIIFLVALAYELYFIGIKGATIGKKAMGVKVVDATSGNPIGVGRAFLRYIVLAVTGSICTLGYWSPFFDSSRRYQGWHDKASNDFVVSTK